MTFSSEIKAEISKLNNYKNKKILQAEFLGYILSGNSVIEDSYIKYITENEYSIERFFKILFNLKINYNPDKIGKKFIAEIEKSNEIENLININYDEDEDFQKAIVKGAFLGAGSITDPNKYYHLEIIFEHKSNSEYILNICKLFGVNLKLMKNKEKYILYIKDGEEISKFLALIGSNNGVLTFEEIRIKKEIKNNVNRLVNCETANLSKIVNASVNQINDIKLIQNLKKFDELPDYLKEIAIIRLENPDMSLKDLGELLDKPIGKSGVNHRLNKIHEIAEELKNSVS